MRDSARPPSGHADDQGDLFEVARLWQFAAFVARAPLRHRRLAIAAIVGATALGIAALVVVPKKWEVTATVLAQRSPLMGTLSNPGMNRDWDVPTRAARELLIRRDNLIALCEQIHFVDRHLAARAPAVRMRDWVFAKARGRERTHAEILDGIVDTLESRLWLAVGAEGIVTIGFMWTDRHIALDVVQAAVQSFMEGRYASEIKMVGETISILQGHDARIEKEIATTLAQLEEKQRALRIRSAPRLPEARAQGPQDEEMARLQSTLAARRRAAADLEEFRRQRQLDLQTQLTQQLAVYAPEHPLVVSTRSAIESMNRPSPQIDLLRKEIQELERDVRRRGGRVDVAVAAAAVTIGGELANAARLRVEAEDPRLEYERRQLDLLLRQHSHLLERIDAARIEMDTAQAGFKYKYSIVTPPQLPRAPVKPYALLFIGGGLAGGIALALFLSAAADMRSGRIVERWQIERELELPLLGEARK